MSRVFSFLVLFWIVSSIHSVAHANISLGSFNHESEATFVSGSTNTEHYEILKTSPTSIPLDAIAPRYQLAFYRIQAGILSNVVQVFENNSYHLYISGLSPPFSFLI